MSGYRSGYSDSHGPGSALRQNVSVSLRKLSFITLAVGILLEIGETVLSALILGSIKLDALFIPELVAGYTVEHVTGSGFILLFAVQYLMSHVFRYGQELQQLSDETL